MAISDPDKSRSSALFTPDEWPCRLLSERHRDILILRLACDLIVNSDYSSIDRYAG
jgi:hypothetical protein